MTRSAQSWSNQTCPRCLRRYAARINANNGMSLLKNQRQGNLMFGSYFSSKCFASSHQLVQHNRIHTGERPYKCTWCDKRFKQLSHLQQHSRLHSGERPYKCTAPDCGRAFIQLSNLQQHMRSHCSVDKQDNKDKRYFCGACGKGFKGQGSLMSHQTKKHANAGVKNEPPESCPFCHLILPSSDDVAVHIKKEHSNCFESHGRVTAPFSCPICGRTYTNEGSYRKHLESHPGTFFGHPASSSALSSIRFWPCSVCSSVFTTESGLLNHMEQMRTDSKHQFEAQIILSCAAAERRLREASSSATQTTINSASTSSASSIMAVCDINRNSSFI